MIKVSLNPRACKDTLQLYNMFLIIYIFIHQVMVAWMKKNIHT